MSTEPLQWVTCIKNLVKIGLQFRRYNCGQTNTHTHTNLDTQTDRQTDTLITILRSPIVGGVKKPETETRA